jgi:RHS repeat-associated protein
MNWLHRSILIAVVLATQAHATTLGDLWLRQHNFTAFDWDLDHDGDGATAREEYFFGTDPLSATSRPPVLDQTWENSDLVISWPSRLGARYQLESSSTLTDWLNRGAPFTGDGNVIEAQLTPSGQREFFRIEALTPLDSDGDGLSAIEEAILGTSPLLADTDGDTLSDGDEVFRTFTNPLIVDPLGGTISGAVKTDPNGDGNSADGQPLASAQVYLDLNFNGKADSGEPMLSTDASGAYAFTHLSPGVYSVRQVLQPGQLQTLPAPGASPVLNGLPDDVVEYVHAPGGNLPTAYGRAGDPNAVTPLVVFPITAQSVSPSLVLKPIGKRGLTPAAGVWSYTEVLTLPQNATILLRFDETIIDRPGADLVVHKLISGAGEKASLEIGYTPDAMIPVTTLTENFAASTGTAIDLADFGIHTPVRYVRITGQDLEGVLNGFELVGVEAINYAKPDADALAVTILGTEAKPNNHFARHFRDDPPSVFLFVEDREFRAGQTAAVRVQASDDISIASLTLTANGASVPLNANGEGTVAMPSAGLISLVATATDNAAHTATQEALLYVNNADGSSPFSPNLTGASAGEQFVMRIITPAAGGIVNADTSVIANIEGVSSPTWRLDYAPVDLIDPYNMPAPDSDWIQLGTGSGFLTNQSAGTFPASSLPNGIYFLRLSATPTIGGLTSYLGQVVAKGVNAQDIEPRVTITSPAQHSTVPLTVAINGSITSTRPLREWYAEYAPTATVDLNNLGSNEPPWVRFASGTTTINNALIARFDASRVQDGSYIVRIVAWNDLRLGWVEPLPLEVAGSDFKPGRLSREFTDLKLPVGGVPFEIKRVYDSLDAGTDRGLGYGWKLALFNADIRETIARTGSGMFGATPFREGTRVYMNTPDGRRVGFTFHAEPGVASFLGTVYKAVFNPDPGVYEKLEVPEGDTPFLTIDGNGNAALYLLGLAWNPTTYVLTTTDGVRHTFDEDAGFMESRDLSGNTLVSTLNGLRHSTGAAIDFVRDGNGRITQIHAPDGVTVSYGYNASGDLISVTDNDGRTTQLGYYSTHPHYLKDVTDPLGRVGVTYEYDAAGTLTGIVDEHGNRTQQNFDPAGFTGDITDRNGHVTHLVYNARGNITQETNALGEVTSYTYNDPANPDKATSKTDALGHTTTWTYDARGKVTQMQLPSFITGTATYDANGNVLTHHDLDGNDSTFTYDAKQRLTHSAIPGLPTEDYTYSPEGKVTQITSPGNNDTLPQFVTNLSYDANGRLARTTDNLGQDMQTTVNALGDITGATLPGGRSFAFTMDANGLPVQTTDPYNHQSSIVQENDGALKVTNRLGQIRNYRLGTDNQLDQYQHADGTTVTATRDAARNLTGLTDTAGNTSNWSYDALNRVTHFTDANGASSSIGYDAVGNVVEIIDRNGKRRTFTYTNDNRLTHERWHDATGTVIRDFTVSYFFGRLDYISDGSSSWSFLGLLPRPTNISVNYAGQLPRALAYQWGNDSEGSGCCGSEASATAPQPTALTVTGGIQFMSYTAAYEGARLRRLQWSPPDGSASADIQFQRGADGLLSEVRRVIGPDPGAMPRTRSTFTWDLLGRLIGQNHTDGAGVALHANAPVTYTRDAESRITGITRAGEALVPSYDVMNRLTSVTHTSGANETYTYDSLGVRMSSHALAGPATVGTGNRQMAIGNFTFVYDAEGNTTSKTNTTTGEVTRYTYDHRNQLTLATIHANSTALASTTVEFAYDYAGRMMSRSLNGAKTWFVYDRDMPIAEFADGANTFSAAFCYSPDRLDDFHGAWRASTGQQWFLKDQVGTVLGATDASGALLYWSDYDAFGNARGAVAPGTDAIRYAGRFWNEALGLYEMRARFYDPLLGRFTQEDPAGFHGGGMNLYAYASNNPLIWRDPTGRNDAIEYIELITGIVRPSALCGYASCLGGLWSGVANSVINRAPAAKPPNQNCWLELFGIPSSIPSPLGVATLGFGYASQFVPKPGLAPGVGLYVEGLSFAECMAKFGQ